MSLLLHHVFEIEYNNNLITKRLIISIEYSVEMKIHCCTDSAIFNGCNYSSLNSRVIMDKSMCD